MKATGSTPDKISIVIPSLNSPTIGQTVESLRSQIYGNTNIEIIIVGMDEYGLIQSDTMIRFVETAEPLCAAAARNLGVARATGDVVAFLDADCVAARDWFRKLVACHESQDVYAVAGGVDFPADEYWTLSDNISTFYDYHVSAPAGERLYAPTLNFSVRRHVLDDVGLFDESFPGAAGEDIDLTLRIRLAGYPLLFEPNLLVYHLPLRNSLIQMLKRSFVFGQAMMKVLWRYRDQRGLAHLHRHALPLFVLAPLLGAGVTLKIFLTNRRLLKYWFTAPAVFLAKVAWRVGGAYQIYRIGRVDE